MREITGFQNKVFWFPNIGRLQRHISVPVMRVMDGFGRNLTDQYYKVGSSLEIVCEVRDNGVK